MSRGRLVKLATSLSEASRRDAAAPAISPRCCGFGGRRRGGMEAVGNGNGWRRSMVGAASGARPKQRNVGASYLENSEIKAAGARLALGSQAKGKNTAAMTRIAHTLQLRAAFSTNTQLKEALPNDLAARDFLRALSASPDPTPSVSAASSSQTGISAYDALRVRSPYLLSALTQGSFTQIFASLIRRQDDLVASELVADVMLPPARGPFTTAQKIDGLKALIGLWSRRAEQFSTPDLYSSGVLSSPAVADYFATLRSLCNNFVADMTLSPNEARGVLGVLIRSRHSLLWERDCLEVLWDAASPALEEGTGQQGGGINTHVGFSLIAALYDPTFETRDRNATTKLALKIFGDLIDWGFVNPEDTFTPGFDSADSLSSDDRSTLTILGSLARAGARQARRLAPSIADDFFSAHAAKGPLHVLERLAREELEARRERTLGPFGKAYYKLAREVLRQYLLAEGARVGTRERIRSSESPAREAVEILLSLNAFLPLVENPAPARRGSPQPTPAESDANLSGYLLDWLVSLGHGSLLVYTYLSLLRQHRPRAPGWSLPQVLRSLSAMASPLPGLMRGFRNPSASREERQNFPQIVSVGAGMGPAMSRQRLVYLVLFRLMGADEIRNERDPRMQEVRRQALGLAVDHPSPFPWGEFLSNRDARTAPRGSELASMGAFLVEMIAELWKLGWVDAPPSARSQVPLRLLSCMTSLASSPSPHKRATRDLLMSVVRLFTADRTPTYDPSRSPYFTVPEPILTHADTTALIRAHLVIGGDLALRFATEGFERMAREKWVPTAAEDMPALWQVMKQLEGARAGGNPRLEEWWAERAAKSTAIGIDPTTTGEVGGSRRVTARVEALRGKLTAPKGEAQEDIETKAS